MIDAAERERIALQITDWYAGNTGLGCGSALLFGRISDALEKWGALCANEALERSEALAKAAEQLLAARSQTEMTYEDAYHFTFKSGPGREAWTALIGALEAIRKLKAEG